MQDLTLVSIVPNLYNNSILMAKMIKRNSHGILESIKQGISNGVVEGLNNKIKTAFKRAYGLNREMQEHNDILDGG